jgi:hypothetical protein
LCWRALTHALQLLQAAVAKEKAAAGKAAAGKAAVVKAAAGAPAPRKAPKSKYVSYAKYVHALQTERMVSIMLKSRK